MTDISADFNLEPEVSLTADFELNPNPSMEVSYRLNTFENDHTQLINRDVSGQHPISAITGLRDELDSISEDITLVEDNLTQSITDEKDRAELAEGNLSDAISDESTARQNADNTLTANLANEVNARISADTSLTTLLGATNQTLNTHIADVNNPHQVTKTQLGLGNVDNTSDMNKPISTATQAALDGMVTIATGQIISGAKTFSNTVTMAGQTPIAASHNYNSYAVFQRLPNTREQIFSNGGDKLRLRGSETRPQYNGNDLALYSDVTDEGADLTAHINNKNNPHEVTKAQVGLGNVSNLAPADLPISTATQNALDVVNGDIDNIEGLIPNQATTSNQLADKSFVNSSISTNTANFIGTFSSVQDLEAYSGTVTNNDYAFVETTDTAGNTLYDRYKYTDSTNSWQFEYELNNSSFTANQWAAINSGATATNIGQIATNTSAITSINTTIGGYGNIVTHNVSEFATASQGEKADTAVQPADLATVATTGDYDDLIDKPTIPTDTSDLTNGAGYITSSALSGYATQSWVGNQGYITGITSGDVTSALGYTPYNSTNPDGYITGITSGDVTSALGYTPYNSTNPDGYITGITSGDVTTALGYTPYNSTNPNGYTSNVGTVTSVNNTSPDGSGNVTIDLSGKADVDMSNVNASGKSLISGLSMPSNHYDDLTLGASGAEYTAPANGWFCMKKAASGSNQYLSLQTPKIQLDSDATSSGKYVGLAMPVSKGDVLTIYYSLGGSTTIFRFIYAQGEV